MAFHINDQLHLTKLPSGLPHHRDKLCHIPELIFLRVYRDRSLSERVSNELSRNGNSMFLVAEFNFTMSFGKLRHKLFLIYLYTCMPLFWLRSCIRVD